MHRIYPAIPLLGIYSWKSHAHLQRHIRVFTGSSFIIKIRSNWKMFTNKKRPESFHSTHSRLKEHRRPILTNRKHSLNTTWKNKQQSVDLLETYLHFCILPCSPFKKVMLSVILMILEKGKNCYNCTDMP